MKRNLRNRLWKTNNLETVNLKTMNLKTMNPQTANLKKTAYKITALAAAAVLSASSVFVSAGAHPVPVLAAQHSAAKQYYITADVLNVRSGPDKECSVIGTLTRGMQVKVYSIRGEHENRWAKIRFAGLTAYVSAKYLSRKAE